VSQKAKEVYASLLNPSVSNVPDYVPGKTTSQIVAEHGLNPTSVIKLNSNENPLGPSPKAMKAVAEAAGSLSLYPTADASNLR